MLADRKAALMALPWPAFFEALPTYLRIKESVATRRVGDLYLHSYYVSPNEWDIWLSRSKDPCSG